MDIQDRELPAGEFKTTCLKLMDEVAQDRRTVTVTKHGKPVARLVPIKDQPGSPFGWLKGSVTLSGDIVGVGGQISNSVS
jgi:prevent-host-death family protein